MLLIIIVTIIVIILINKENQKKNSNQKDNKQKVEEKRDAIPYKPSKINYNDYYVNKKYIISYTEYQFYKVLLEISKELDMMLFTQVSLYNIILPKNNKDYTYFNKIKSKSIDFVLTDKDHCLIKLCIELDDRSHNDYKRIERDIFINDLFRDLDIKLLRIRTMEMYNKEKIKEMITKKLDQNKKELV